MKDVWSTNQLDIQSEQSETFIKALCFGRLLLVWPNFSDWDLGTVTAWLCAGVEKTCQHTPPSLAGLDFCLGTSDSRCGFFLPINYIHVIVEWRQTNTDPIGNCTWMCFFFFFFNLHTNYTQRAHESRVQGVSAVTVPVIQVRSLFWYSFTCWENKGADTEREESQRNTDP